MQSMSDVEIRVPSPRRYWLPNLLTRGIVRGFYAIVVRSIGASTTGVAVFIAMLFDAGRPRRPLDAYESDSQGIRQSFRQVSSAGRHRDLSVGVHGSRY